MDDRQGVSGLIFKTHDNATPDNTEWQRWVVNQIRAEFTPLHEAIGCVVAQERKAAKHARDDLMREVDLVRREANLLKREIDTLRSPSSEVAELREALALLRREFATLQGEVAVEKKLRALKDDIPSVPEIEANVHALRDVMRAEQDVFKSATNEEIARLNDELATTRDQLATVRDIIISQFGRKPRSSDVEEIKTTMQQVVAVLKLSAEEDVLKECGLESKLIEHQTNGHAPEN